MSNLNNGQSENGSTNPDITQEIRTSPDRVAPMPGQQHAQPAGQPSTPPSAPSSGHETVGNFAGQAGGLGAQWAPHNAQSGPAPSAPSTAAPSSTASPFGYAPTAGAYPPAPGSSTTSGSGDSGSTKKMIGIAAIAALLASALTGVAVAGLSAGGGSGISTGNTTVVNGDPKDFADAGTVNWSATASEVTPSVVAITVGSGNTASGQGSGVILDRDGNIVTNNHVVAGASRLQVTLNNNKSYEAKVVGKDPSTDLAVIKIDKVKDLKPIKLADDSKLVVGQSAMAVGNPLGLSGTVTTGIVSALDRPVTTSESSDSGSSSSSAEAVITNAIQTSAAINPGNSGGALVNGSGELIGINSSIASLSDGTSSSGQSGNIGIGFAIPTTVVKNITNQLIKDGKATHALLGLSAETSDVEQDGALLASAKVRSLTDDGAAKKAGVAEGDQIISIDGEPVTSSNSLVGQVRARTPGTKVKLTLIRNGQAKDIEVTLGSKESK